MVQEARSQRALKALRDLAEPSVRLIRDGIERVAPVNGLVPGDIILIGEGQRIPADGRLVDGDVLSVDESALTGESAPIAKATARTDLDGPACDDRLVAGTLIASGQAVMKVLETGPRTALGKIGASLATIRTGATPLQKSTRRLVAVFGLLAVALSGTVTVAYGVLGNCLTWIKMTQPEILNPANIVLNVSFALDGLIADRDRAYCRAVAFFLKVYRSTPICLIENCAHPIYRTMLADYYQRAVNGSYGQQTPMLLDEALYWHRRYLSTQSMVQASLSDGSIEMARSSQ